MSDKDDTLSFTQRYDPYLKRVRVLMQRYVLRLETQGKGDSGLLGADQRDDDVARRCLFGLEMSPDRLAAVAGLDEVLSTTYEALGAQIPNNRFEVLRWECGLSEEACDALWIMLAGTLVPEFMWLYRTLWGDANQSLFARSFLFHVVDPTGARMGALFRAFEPTSPLMALRLVVRRCQRPTASWRPRTASCVTSWRWRRPCPTSAASSRSTPSRTRLRSSS